MKRATSMPHNLVLAILVLLACAMTPSVAAAGGNPGVLPVNSDPYGLTYGEWSAKFWQWTFSLPFDGHPLFDTADCSAGQSGPVWFLGGTFAAIEIEPGVILGEVERTCTIPAGKSIFFPLVNAECSTLEGNGETEAELRACANFFADFIVPESLFCVVDGNNVQDLPDFRVESPPFTYGPLPENNLPQLFGLDAPAGTTSPAVGDGVHVMLAPLSVGKHTLHFGGLVDLTGIGGPMFIQDIAYHITVVPHN
jgi:hypothetical protein